MTAMNMSEVEFNASRSYNASLADADGDVNDTMADMEYIYDRTEVRAIFIALYSVVFAFCFFGNLLVILVVTLSRRLRSITNFFLANLAVADLCVGVFCVFQNLSTYLVNSWVLGDTMCKMYLFVHSLSYTASIFILVVICIERYFAIIHPIRCRQILTSTRLGLVMVGVWLSSALYSSPRFLFVGTHKNPLSNGATEMICSLKRNIFNTEIFDMVNFALLYVTPLCVMTALYSRIAVGLWHSNRDLERHATGLTRLDSCPSALYRDQGASVTVKFTAGAKESQVTINSSQKPRTRTYSTRKSTNNNNNMSSSQNVLRARRGVIRMLIVVVLTFALCNLPYHARKMWQYWSPHYSGGSTFMSLFTPLTFLVTYLNSAVNPLLYALMSRNFRKGMLELLGCTFRGSKKNADAQMRSVGRCSSMKSTKTVVMTVVPTPTPST